MTPKRVVIPPPPIEPTYLGDGVQASFDGWHVWLISSGGQVALEPEVLIALNDYVERIRTHYNAPDFAKRR